MYRRLAPRNGIPELRSPSILQNTGDSSLFYYSFFFVFFFFLPSFINPPPLSPLLGVPCYPKKNLFSAFPLNRPLSPSQLSHSSADTRGIKREYRAICLTIATAAAAAVVVAVAIFFFSLYSALATLTHSPCCTNTHTHTHTPP